ncbi:MAG: hypothetical protein AAF986_08225 [Pseudomonadota bacterium]
MTAYPATYYDGVTTSAHAVSVTFTDVSIISSADGYSAEWPFKTLRVRKDDEGEVRIATTLRPDPILVLAGDAAAAMRGVYPQLFDKSRIRRKAAAIIAVLVAVCALVAAGLSGIAPSPF